MGILSKIKSYVLGDDDGNDKWNLDGEEDEESMSGYYNDYDNEPTVLYSDNPQMPQEIKGGGNPDRLNDATMSEVARINATHLIPGQVVNTRGRGQRQQMQQAGPRRIGNARMAPQQRQQQVVAQQQMAQQQMEWQRQQWERQQWEQQQQPPQQQIWDQQQAQDFYQQQQMYYQQQQQQPAVQVNPAINRVPANYGEPYYEMIVSNGKYHFYLDLPGVAPADIAVSYVNMNLVITGTRKLHAEQMAPKTKGKGTKGKKSEPDFDAMVTIPPFVEKFSYSFNFPRPVDQDSFKTDLTAGVLHIEMDILGATGRPAGIAIKVG